MKRKQKTPRRIRPVENSDVDDAFIQACVDANAKQQKRDVETKTSNADMRIATSKELNTRTPTIALDGFFKNKSHNQGLPLILDVYSLSDRSSKPQEYNVTRKQNTFPVTPPYSPPIQDKGEPVTLSNQHSYQYTNDNMNGYPVPNSIPTVPTYNAQSQYIPSEVIYDNPMTTQLPIGNGVPPVAGTVNQSRHFYFQQQPVTQKAVNYYSPQNVPNTYDNSMTQLKSKFTLPNQYLVKESSFTRNSNLYTRFKLQDNTNTQICATSQSQNPSANNNYGINNNNGPFTRNHYEVTPSSWTAVTQIPENNVSVDNSLSTNDMGLLTPREMKVKKLKKLIQEQEEFLKKLKAHR